MDGERTVNERKNGKVERFRDCNQVGIKFFRYEFVKHALYFVESATALNEFKYFFTLIMFIMLRIEFLHENLHFNC